MERVKDSQIEAWVARMQRQGMDIGLDGQYGRWRVTNKSGSANLSPRAPNREILEWLSVYDKGWSAGREFQFDKIRKECQGYVNNGEVHSFAGEMVDRLASVDSVE